MTPGPTIIYQCYKCEGNFKYPTIGSGNTFGARFWSDGKKDAPMLPDQPWLIKCPNCDALIWRDELKQMGEAEAGPSAYNIPLPILLNRLEIRPTPKHTNVYNLYPATTPSFLDYYFFDMADISNTARKLNLGFWAWLGGSNNRRDKQKERYVRQRTWWAGNDCRRKSKEIPFSSMEIENLRAYITLLDENDETDRIMKAEAHRELGEFEKAEKFLAMPFGDELKDAAGFIRNLNKQRITSVTEMIFE